MSDEYICSAPELRLFIPQVQAVLAGAASISEKIALIRPHFSRILADPDWLPAEFRRTPEAGGMGLGIANWLLYRDTSGALSLSALVSSPGAVTPIHDHLAWGLVGLYLGEQDEEVYEPSVPVKFDADRADLKLVQTNRLQAGSLYELIPPLGDIHRVITTSAGPSISLHLLTNDVGCTLRHRFTLETGAVTQFRSGYTNRKCEQG